MFLLGWTINGRFLSFLNGRLSANGGRRRKWRKSSVGRCFRRRGVEQVFRRSECQSTGLLADVLVATARRRAAADGDHAVSRRRRSGWWRWTVWRIGRVAWWSDPGCCSHQIVHFQIRVSQDVLEQLLVNGVPLQHLLHLLPTSHSLPSQLRSWRIVWPLWWRYYRHRLPTANRTPRTLSTWGMYQYNVRSIPTILHQLKDLSKDLYGDVTGLDERGPLG